MALENWYPVHLTKQNSSFIVNRTGRILASKAVFCDFEARWAKLTFVLTIYISYICENLLIISFQCIKFIDFKPNISTKIPFTFYVVLSICVGNIHSTLKWLNGEEVYWIFNKIFPYTQSVKQHCTMTMEKYQRDSHSTL